MGELKFLLGLQITQLEFGTFVCQSKYTKEMLKDQKARELQRKVIVEEDPVATSKFYTESTSPSTV